jgi:hypothetical protein
MLIRLECYKIMKHLLGDEIYEPLKAWWWYVLYNYLWYCWWTKIK